MKKALLDALTSEDLLPNSDLKIDRVIEELTCAIEQYHQTLPQEISNTRRELEAHVSTLQKAHEQLLNMSPQALQIYCNASGTPKGQFTSTLQKALTRGQEVLSVALDMNNREHDYARNVWAYHVARIMRDIMEIFPAGTRDNAENITGTNGGAAYARLLRKVAIVGDIELSNDLYPLMKRALELLKNPHGNNNST